LFDDKLLEQLVWFNTERLHYSFGLLSSYEHSRINHQYNIQYALPEDRIDMLSAHTQFTTFYEKYPHLKEKIQLTWGTAECRKIISDTLLSDRPNRAGFPQEDAKTLFNILLTHDQLFPELNPDQPGDIPFRVFSAEKKAAPLPAQRGINLFLLIKVLAGFGIVLIVLKEVLRIVRQ
jgi:hypothetical protein